MSTPNPAAEAVAIKVEQTMRQLKVWGVPPPVLKPYRQPFAMDAMPFENWIQLVLVPRLREVARGEAPMPPSSNLAGHAVREFDGWDAMQPLIDALREVDALSKPYQSPVPAVRMPVFSVLTGLAHLGTILGVVFSIYVSKWVSAGLDGYYPAHVSAVYFGSIEPDARHNVLRLATMAEIGEGNVLKPGESSVLLDVNAIPTPGVLMKLPEPLTFRSDAPPKAEAVRDWLVHAGVAPDSPSALPASRELLDVLAVAMTARTRPELEQLGARLPAGTPEAQVVDIPGHTPEWLYLTVGVVAAVVFCVPFVVWAFLIARRRRAGRGG